MYKQRKILAPVYEMFIYEIFRKKFNQFCSKMPLNFRVEKDSRIMYVTRRSSKGFLPITKQIIKKHSTQKAKIG